MASRSRRRLGHLALGAAAPRWRRSPGRVGRWVLAGGLAVLAAALFAHLTGEADTTIADWGTTKSVIVARRDLDPGRIIDGDDVSRLDLPAALVPPSAEEGDPTGRIVTRPVVAGEVLSSQRLAPDGAQGVAALVPDGRRAVAVPIAGTGMHLRVGDHVDVYATGSTDGLSGSSGRSSTATPRAATDALVVEVSDTAVTLAVEASEVAAVAHALGEGTPVLALHGTG